MHHWIDRITRTVGKVFCDKQLVKILHSEPVTCQSETPVLVFSMIGHRVVNDYLVAVKTLLQRCPVSQVHILNDGSLTTGDRATLQHHLPHLVIHEYADVDMTGLPRGNCWERLVTLLTLAEDNYVIQLDADIVVNGDIAEVLVAIVHNDAFLLGSPEWSVPLSMNEMSSIAKHWGECHIQGRSEQEFAGLPLFQQTTASYFRGCAAFVGLPAGTQYLPLLKQFSAQMTQALGEDKWNTWGSEQVASNVIVSSAKGAHVLPWPKYQTFMFPPTEHPHDEASLIHFMGTCRYQRGAYRRIATQAMQDLV
ncbi:hypothetical protein L4C36_03225 [Photobacterium japonica]|uniref:hypothetical protein n=1 Tax=Photobacterium japonica TaxID=2910235 RepID=UPI003D1141A7